MPAVSIIVPVYNAAETLPRCTRAVLTQSLRDLELILVDDGSADSSGALCDQIAARDARVRVLHNTNGGPAAARNAGLGMARGRYVGFADADDEPLPALYETLLARAEETNADLSLCDYARHTGGSDEPCPALPGTSRVLERDEIETGVLPYFFGYAPGELAQAESICPFADRRSYVWLCLYRRTLLEAHGIRFPDEKQYYTEDNLFNLLAAAHAARLVYTAQALYRYHDAAGSFTGCFQPGYLACRLRKYAFLRQFATENGLHVQPETRLPRKICAELPTLVNYYALRAPGLRQKLRWVRTVLQAGEVRAARRAVPRAEWPAGRRGLTLRLARPGGALPLTLACLAQQAARK